MCVVLDTKREIKKNQLHQKTYILIAMANTKQYIQVFCEIQVHQIFFSNAIYIYNNNKMEKRNCIFSIITKKKNIKRGE